MNKLICASALCLSIILSANAQIGSKIKSIGKKAKDSVTQKENSNQKETPKTETSNAEVGEKNTSISQSSQSQRDAYLEVIMGGKSVMKGGDDCLNYSAEFRNGGLQVIADEGKCRKGMEKMFKMNMQVLGIGGKGTYRIPKQGSDYAGKLDITPTNGDNNSYGVNVDKNATANVTLTELNKEFVEGKFTATLVFYNGKKETFTGKFKFPINLNDR